MDSQLYRAAYEGDVHTLRLLLQQFYSRELYSHLTPRKNTVLHIAARKGHLDFINEILKIEPGISGVVNEDGNTALHEAAKDGHAQVVDILLEHNKNEANILNNVNESALFIASAKGHLRIVRRLLLEVNSAYELTNVRRLSDKWTSFHAAAHGGHLDVVKELLVKTPEIVFNVDISGNTPLHSASSSGHLEIVKEILARKSAMCYDVNEIGISALHVAATMGHADVVEELVRCRPDCVEIKSNDGKTALHLAVENNHAQVVERLLEKTTILDTQIANEPDNKGNTALHLATLKNLQQMVELLVRCEMVNVKATNEDGFTALEIARREMKEAGGQKATGDHVSAVVAGLIIQLTFQAVVSIPEWVKENMRESPGPPFASNAPQSSFAPQLSFEIENRTSVDLFLISNIVSFIFAWYVLLTWTLHEKFHSSRVYRYGCRAFLIAALFGVLIAFCAAMNGLTILGMSARVRIVCNVSYWFLWTSLGVGTVVWPFRKQLKKKKCEISGTRAKKFWDYKGALELRGASFLKGLTILQRKRSNCKEEDLNAVEN